MDSEDNKTQVAEAATDSSTDKESFTVVKSKKAQKRKREQDGSGMDTEESVASKRPQFPPISGEKLKVIKFQQMYVVKNTVYVKCYAHWLCRGCSHMSFQLHCACALQSSAEGCCCWELKSFILSLFFGTVRLFISCNQSPFHPLPSMLTRTSVTSW